MKLERPAPIQVGSQLARCSGSAPISSLSVSVGSLAEDFPQLNDNESYTLAISAAGEATLAAPTVFGALHGLETFSQLVRFDFIGGAYTLRWAPWRIEDEPRFPHRGLSESSNVRPAATQSQGRVISALLEISCITISNRDPVINLNDAHTLIYAA